MLAEGFHACVGLREVLKLSDFGLAVHLQWGQRLIDKCGTPAFMSPEQHQLPHDSKGALGLGPGGGAEDYEDEWE